MPKSHLPLPTREAVDEAVGAAMRRALDTHGTIAASRLDVRLHGNASDDRIARIGIGCAMHPDAGARTPFEIVEPPVDAAWAETCHQHIDALVRETACLDRRRGAFDPAGTGATPPRWAWDIHPTAASLLSLYRTLPTLDGSHRIDGEHGRIVELQDAPGVNSATIAYGDGIVRIVAARFPNGSTLTTESGWVRLRVEGTMPEVLASSLLRRPAGAIGAQLGHGAKAGLGRVMRVRRIADELEMTLSDTLVPWDQRRLGGEDWRSTRMRHGKQPGGRHG